ncbi:hypothetical protein PTSG_03725 [Salpingoeca rosetta]|uniref:Transglutaminase-like domain-containing protein n=1 Tax=Salpingoeca rosetta (strain ATCC 50818 / BSB-021) TaxID=946362 RepID=F2U6E4_SALR5|nr:uncharacterized protein PTSG_03725 [Salpingoeca rosetta]EGD83085.1 hypothetical protein PTSG_03725 [Salpingoeca rosetta]|eukprot:XP_004995449.1 hypothetical protein PTSG_03725 [Salpingoeca rosetta]
MSSTNTSPARPSAALAVTKLLKAHTHAAFQTAAETIITYAENLKRNPDDDKYRRINLANTSFQTRVYQVPGGEECMQAMGFVKEAGHLVFSGDSLKSVDNLLTVLKAALAAKQKQVQAMEERRRKEARDAQEQQARQQMVQTLTSHISRMRIYEQPALQAQARARIPVDELRRRADDRDDKGEKSAEDRLLLELLRWFKKEFFTWVDTLPCEYCGGKTKVAGMTAPLGDEARWQAGRVEVHQCKSCGRSTRFPRYNHPGKLLETRRGRCGEWANCFVLCCRALGFHTRYVLDYTDHVWAEVFSTSQQRWLHCDPCEQACDKPLMYERGWGKKLSYVFAFTPIGMADVIWRYSQQREATLLRRDKVSEDWLADMIKTINQQLLAGVPEIQREAILQSLETERQSLFAEPRRTEPALSAQELVGRQSGAEEWRRARGELGDGSQPAAATTATPTATPTRKEPKQQQQQEEKEKASVEKPQAEQKIAAANTTANDTAAQPQATAAAADDDDDDDGDEEGDTAAVRTRDTSKQRARASNNQGGDQVHATTEARQQEEEEEEEEEEEANPFFALFRE